MQIQLRLKFYYFFPIVITFLFSDIHSQGTWLQKANFGPGPRGWASGFSIGSKGYIGLGVNPLSVRWNDFWEWDQTSNTWTQKASFPGVPRDNAVGFSIGNKGYLGIGGIYSGGPFYNDFWEWDQATNSWTQKANFPGTARQLAVGFAIGTKGYIGTGGVDPSGPFYSDFWEWDQLSNIWTQRATYAGAPRNGATGFSIGSKGYIGTGRISGNFTDDFWEWDQSSNVWTQKATFPGGSRYCASSFSIGTKGYIGTGYNGVYQQSFWEWDQSTNVWTQQANFGGGLMSSGTGFSIGNCGYMGIGGSSASGNLTSSFWEFCPIAASTPTISSSAGTTICQGQNIILSAAGNGAFLWSTGATSSTISITPSTTTTYSITTSAGCSCSASDQITITVTTCSAPISSFSSATSTVCQGLCVQFTDQSAGAPSYWSWSFPGGSPPNSIAQNPLICYDSIGNFGVSLITMNTNGSDTLAISNYITVKNCDCPYIYLPNAFSPNNDNENDFFIPQSTSCVKSFSIIIYNSWGQKIFESNDITTGWDGSFARYTECTDVFVYKAYVEYLNGNIEQRKGNVSVMR